MKYLVTIIAFVCCLQSFGQDLSNLKAKFDVLENRIEFKIDSTGLSKLVLPSFLCSESKSDKGWHVQDVNNDGLKDLIYSGYCQPYFQTAIFLNSNNGFKVVHNYPGKLLSITKTANQTKLIIIKDNMGCDYYSDLIEVSIANNSKVTKQILSFHFDTNVELTNTLVYRSFSGILRSSPVVDDTQRKDVCTGEAIIGNHIDKLTGQQVVVLSKKKDWLLVILEKSEGYSKLGWIKK